MQARTGPMGDFKRKYSGLRQVWRHGAGLKYVKIPCKRIRRRRARARFTALGRYPGLHRSPPLLAKLGVAIWETETAGAKAWNFPCSGILHPHFARLRPAKSPAHGHYWAVLSHVEFGAGMNGAGASLAKLCSENLPAWERNGATKPARSYEKF